MKRLKSIFTDADTCYFTGTPHPEHHHILGAFNRSRSEKYGFTIPLHPKLHPNGASVDDEAIRMTTGFADRWELDRWLKQECQRRFERTHSRDEWLAEFGRSELDD